MPTPIQLVLGVAVLVGLGVLFVFGRRLVGAWLRYRDTRMVVCPENREMVAVEEDARHAAATAPLRRPGAARRADRKLRVAIPGQADLYENCVRDFFGETGYELVELPSWEALFEAQERFDVALGLAEVGMAWSLVHPDFTVVIPKDRIERRPLAFALAPDNEDLARVIDQWVVLLQRARGNVDAAYDYWILGKGTEQRRPRWSIARDVLGWIE